MATYFLVENSTREGSMTVKEAPQRAEGVLAFAKSLGVDIREWFFTVGQFDFIMKVEAPDERTVVRFMLAVNKSGNVKIEMLRAFTPDEWAGMIAEIP